MLDEEYVKRLIGRLLNYPWREIKFTSEPRIIYWQTEKPYRAELSQKPPYPPQLHIKLDSVGLMLWKSLQLSGELAPLFSYPVVSSGKRVSAWVLTADLSTAKARLKKVLEKLDRALRELSSLGVEDFKVKLLAGVLKDGERPSE